MNVRPDRMLFGLGLLVAASAVPHALLGWPAIAQALVGAGVSADAIGGVGAGWLFGSVAMLTLGAVVVLAARDARAGGDFGWRAALAVGAAYLAFGVAALVVRGRSHFLAFVALGVGLAWAALRARRP
jgi:hypothetical protein